MQNLRPARNFNYVEHGGLLAEIDSKLNSRHTVILHDADGCSGGVGKTQTALEFAHRHADRYRVIWWAHCGTEESGAFLYTELLAALDRAHGRAPNFEHPPSELKERLALSDDWLLIFDGIESPEDLKSLLPAEITGHVLVTSSSPSDTYENIPVGPMSPAESQALLASYTATDPGVQALAERLGHHPLALSLAGGYMRATGLDTAAVEPRMREAAGGAWPGDPLGVVHLIVALGLAELTAKDRVARDLLALCAYLCADDIPLDLLRAGDDVLSRRLMDAVAEDTGLHLALDSLSTLGLATLHDDSIRVHESVQHVIRQGMNPAPQRAWANAALRLVTKAFPIRNEYADPNPDCVRLLPHALSVASHAERYKVSNLDTSTLLYHAGLYVHACRLLPEARDLYESALRIGEPAFRGPHAVTAMRVNSLGVVQQELGELHRAKDCFERAFEICEAVYGPAEKALLSVDDQSLLTMPVRNLCVVLQQIGDAKSAQRTFERAMKIFVEVYGWNHPMVAECANLFGKTWHTLGRLDRALNCFEKAVLAQESADDPDLVHLALYLDNLGTVLMELSKPTEALARFEHALRLDRQVGGPRDQSVGRDLANQAHALRTLRRLEEAEEAYKEAIGIVEEHEGSESAHVAALLNHLGVVLLGKNDYSQARSCFEQSLATNESIHGPDSNATVRDLTNLGRALEGLEAYSQAIGSFDRAIRILDESGLSDSDRKATVLFRMGHTYEAQEKNDKALECYQRAMNLDTKVHGKGHPSVARDAYSIGALLAGQNETVVAMGHLTLALDIYEEQLGKTHPRARRTRELLEKISS